MDPKFSSCYLFGEFRLDLATRRLTRGEQPVAVTPKALDLLTCLVARAGQIVTKDELLSAVWPDSIVEESNLSQQVFGLRRALGDCSGYIATVPGRGYQFTAPVRLQAPRAPVEPLGSLPVPGSAIAADSTPAPASATRRLWPPLAAAASVVVLLVAAVFWERRHHRPPADYVKVVLADIGNSTGDSALDGILRQVLEIDLGQSPFVDIMGHPETLSILKEMDHSPEAALTPEVLREVCERGNRQVLISGDVSRLGSEYVLALEATECVSGRLLAVAKREAKSQEQLLKALDEAADHLRSQLGESAHSLQTFDVPIEQATTPSLDALKAYSAAEAMLMHAGTLGNVLPMYRRAVTFDPNFAMGYQGLANMYYGANEAALAADAARRAFELSGRVGEREKFAIQTHYHADAEGDLLAAVATAKLWAAVYPRDWNPWLLMAGEYNDMGQYPQAIDAGRKALALNQNQSIIYSVLARALRRSNDLADVPKLGAEAVKHGADGPGLHITLYLTAVMQHDQAALQSEAAWGMQHGGWLYYDTLGEDAAMHGQMRECRHWLELARADALATRFDETNAALVIDQAQEFFVMGKPEVSRQLLATIKQAQPSYAADLAVLKVRLGDEAPARAFLTQYARTSHDTLKQNVDVPLVTAALALKTNRPQDAIQALAPARPFELADMRVIPVRAEAYARAGQWSNAIAEYRKILANPGVDPTAFAMGLSHLGLARAYAATGNSSASRDEYEAQLRLWKNADADVPLVSQVKAEYAHLSSQP